MPIIIIWQYLGSAVSIPNIRNPPKGYHVTDPVQRNSSVEQDEFGCFTVIDKVRQSTVLCIFEVQLERPCSVGSDRTNMGNSSSSVAGYRELRSSLPGSLVHEEDFQLFYSLCKIETARTMSTVLYPSPTQLFFVIISGEVLVQLSNKNVKPTTATAFSVGETIHFFNATLRGGSTISSLEYSDAGECLRNEDIKLALHFRNVDKATAKVIGIDRRSFDEFMIRAKCNTHAVASFLNMSMVELFNSSPYCRTLTAEQVRPAS
jgi:hypothetical protein